MNTVFEPAMGLGASSSCAAVGTATASSSGRPESQDASILMTILLVGAGGLAPPGASPSTMPAPVSSGKAAAR